MTAHAPTITPTSTVDRDRAIAALVAAFSADPVLRWFFPDAGRYLATFPDIVDLVGGHAFDDGTAEVAARCAGAALWVVPGTAFDAEALGALVEASVDTDRHEAVFSLLELLEAHHPSQDVWYLPFIGIDPAHQGRGHGSDLLSRGLARVDRDGGAAYLEASSPRNRALYERHGFQTTTEISVGGSPPMWPMLRPAR